MKITTFLLLISFLTVSAGTFAQKITLKEQRANLEQVLDQIRQQSGYDIVYSNDVLSKSGPVNINVKNASVEEALKDCLRDQPLTFDIEDGTVVIKAKEENFLDNLKNKIKTTLNLPITITGKVNDETGQPMVGVNVREKGAQNAATTDAKGNFSITIHDENSIIVFSYIGYETRELNAWAPSSNEGMVIILKVSENNLREVVINKGYYDEKREFSTGNVSVVTAKTIDQQSVTNVLQALEGRVPGLLITQTNGQPGGGFTVQIRGQNSITSGNTPFYVIDGVPYDSSLPSGLLNGALKNGSPLNFVNPYDIETVEVLKDADATAIYGSRAANGAILITTKKGKAGAMRVDAQVNMGFSSPDRSIQMMNTQQYLQMRHKAFANDGAIPNPNSDFDLTFWDTTRYTNWSKVLTNAPAPYLNAQASVSGGTTNTQYLVGMDYYRQGTSFPTLIAGDGADEKPSFHFNLNTASNNQKFKLSFSGSYVADRNTVQSEDFSADRLALPPDAPPIFNPDGSLNWAPLVPGQAGTWRYGNPYANLYEGYIGRTSSLIGNGVLSYQIIPSLQFKTSVGYTNTQIDEVQTTPTSYYDPGDNITSGNSNFNEMNSHSFIVEPQFNFTKQFGKGIFNALLGGTFQDNLSTAQGLSASDFSSDALLANAQAAGSVYVTGQNNSEYKYEAVYARLNYNLEEKYLLNITARRDGSSRFGSNNQFGNFGAVGAGWIFSKEKWLADALPFLSFGKLRASYGTAGNDQIGNYQYLETYNITSYPYNSVQGFYPTSLANPNLAWEVDKKLEAALELGFLKDRIMLSASFYRNRSSNELVNAPLPELTGFSSIESNLPALVQNIGQEYELHTVNIKSGVFNWSSSINLTLNRNKLLAFPGLATSTYADEFVIGQPLNIIKAFNMIGVNPQTGVYQFEGANGQLTYAPERPNDQTQLININPKFYGGFENTFSYKGFSLDFLFQFVKQTGLNLFGSYNNMPGTEQNEPVAFLNAWQKPGDIAKYERYSQQVSFSSGTPFLNGLDAASSNFAYGDASYIRLKNLSLSWVLPQSWDKTIHFQSCKIFMQGQNLLTFTKYNGIDPESQANTLPPMRILTFGFQLGL